MTLTTGLEADGGWAFGGYYVGTAYDFGLAPTGIKLSAGDDRTTFDLMLGLKLGGIASPWVDDVAPASSGTDVYFVTTPIGELGVDGRVSARTTLGFTARLGFQFPDQTPVFGGAFVIGSAVGVPRTE